MEHRGKPRCFFLGRKVVPKSEGTESADLENEKSTTLVLDIAKMALLSLLFAETAIESAMKTHYNFNEQRKLSLCWQKVRG